MKKMTFMALLLTSFSSMAAYENCTIANGQVTSCESWYQGCAVVDR